MNGILVILVMVVCSYGMANDLSFRGGLGIAEPWQVHDSYEGKLGPVFAVAYATAIPNARFVQLEGDLQYARFEGVESQATYSQFDALFSPSPHSREFESVTGALRVLFTPRARADRLRWPVWHEAGLGLAWGRQWEQSLNHSYGPYGPIDRQTIQLFYRLNVRIMERSNVYIEGRWDPLVRRTDENVSSYVQHVVLLGYRFRV
jgi:hypothetical protein